ncbi:ABC transporter permease [Pseudarcicella hirudinis]|uniref:ABC transporter permease n=1 Tax=Pseudarcicella hirudinis TaxID=1079859 RepID=UPI0035E6D837
MVITEEFAHKYFGDENPIGKVLNIKSWKTLYKVTGVIEKMPSNSHFHFDMLGSLVSNPDAKSSSWMSSGYFTYLVLQDGYDYKKLEAKLPQTVEKYMGPQIKQAMGVSISQFQKKGNKLGLFLQPLTDIHLKSDMTGELEANGDIRYVYIFGAIAIFMLIIACINFTNLSTAEASKSKRSRRS